MFQQSFWTRYSKTIKTFFYHSKHLLPKIDVFGHKILEQNRILIEKITHMDNISIELKKELLLSVIKFTEYGDSFGNFVLKNYEHLINNLL